MSNPSGWAFMKPFDIPDKTDPSQIYLHRRRVIQTPWFGLYLHRIYLPDGDRDPHDHPWPFATFIVRGGYEEMVYPFPWVSLDWAERKTWRRFTMHRLGTMQAHRILTVKPGTITLVFVGKRSRSWGFHTPDGFVDWREYDQPSLGPDPFDS